MSDTPTTSSGEYITLAEAAKLAPGRPTANAVWRWARKGVKSRAGHRVYLRHIRAGGKVLTTAAWVEAFGQELADADREHFRAAADRPYRSEPTPSKRTEHDQARARLAAQGML